jgi:hypothetical protein
MTRVSQLSKLSDHWLRNARKASSVAILESGLHCLDWEGREGAYQGLAPHFSSSSPFREHRFLKKIKSSVSVAWTLRALALLHNLKSKDSQQRNFQVTRLGDTELTTLSRTRQFLCPE